jgi:hypothetical protein
MYVDFKGDIGFEIPTVVVMKSSISQDMTSSSPFGANRRFGGTCRLHL